MLHEDVAQQNAMMFAQQIKCIIDTKQKPATVAGFCQSKMSSMETKMHQPSIAFIEVVETTPMIDDVARKSAYILTSKTNSLPPM